MKTRAVGFSVLLMALALASSAFADPDYKTQWSGTSHDNIFAFAKRGDELWACGSFGLLVKRTPDAQWTRVGLELDSALLDIAFSPAGDGVAVGQNGIILEAKPNSQEWTKRDSGVKDRLLGVAANKRGDFIAVGAFGAVVYKAAGTDSWKTINLPAEGDADLPHLYSALFVSDDDALVVGESETLMTLNKGAGVQQLKLGVPAKGAEGKEAPSTAEKVTPSLFALTYCNGMLVAGGQKGLVVRKRIELEGKNADSAKGLLGDWQSSTIAGTPDIYGLTCTASGTLVAVSNNGVYLTATRNGDDLMWQSHNLGAGAEWLAAVLPFSNDSVLMASPSSVLEVSIGNGK
ncbi:MAG TPA: YCF48-related protein [Candidatus Binataceae bacterium]|nr:YCF48-related protein [Candidatus Binataceae bacterium]